MRFVVALNRTYGPDESPPAFPISVISTSAITVYCLVISIPRAGSSSALPKIARYNALAVRPFHFGCM